MEKDKFLNNWKDISFEFIICSSIWFDDGKNYEHQPKNIDTGFVISGYRHHNCFNTMSIVSKEISNHTKFKKEQGFLTNKNKFVNREESAIIAYESGQIKDKVKKLYSENIF